MLTFPAHPDVDLALELLCTLPVHPDSVAISDLATDFGYTNQLSILSLIEKLRERKYDILTFHSNGTKPRFRCVAIGSRNSMAALADCELYWKTVHTNHTI